MAEPTQGKKHEGMVLIPCGSFMMSNSYKNIENGAPAKFERAVTNDFYIDRFEVTKGAYASYASMRYELKVRDCSMGTLLSILMRDNDIDKLKETLMSKEDAYKANGLCMEIGLVEQRKLSMGGDRYNVSVGSVNWFEADGYCRSIGKRLPTVMEWAKAAEGSLGSEDGENSCNRNGYGIYDMKTGYGEWTDVDRYDFLVGSIFVFPDNAVDDGADLRKVLAQSYGNFGEYSYRHPGNRDWGSGFRCAKDAVGIFSVQFP